MKTAEQLLLTGLRCLVFGGFLLLSAFIVNSQESFGDAKKNGGPENNKMQIRSGLRITKSARQPVIKIELYSDRIFPALNAAAVLVVGKHVFHGGGYGDTEGHILVFTLTPQDFAKTKNGDELIVTYQGTDLDRLKSKGANSDDNNANLRVWRFGKLDKSKIDQ